MLLEGLWPTLEAYGQVWTVASNMWCPKVMIRSSIRSEAWINQLAFTIFGPREPSERGHEAYNGGN